MGFYDGAKDELRSKLKAIFENKDYMEDLQDESPENEFQFTGDVTYNVKVEDDGEYKEYYVSDTDGNIIEIFTDEMVDQDGRLPATIRQSIVTQASEGDMPLTMSSDVDAEVEDVDDEIEDIKDAEDVDDMKDEVTDVEDEDIEDDDEEKMDEAVSENIMQAVVTIDEAGADKEGIDALAHEWGGTPELQQSVPHQLVYTFPLQNPTGEYETGYETFKRQVMNKIGVKDVRGEPVELDDNAVDPEDEEINPV